MNKLDPNRVGISLAATLSALSVACLALVAALPKAATAYLFGSIFHAVDISAMMTVGITVQSALTGLVITAAAGYVLGALFAWVYNRLG